MSWRISPWFAMVQWLFVVTSGGVDDGSGSAMPERMAPNGEFLLPAV
jgi:hypothetical protein